MPQTKVLTVEELVALLGKEDPKALVKSESCQLCVHPVVGVTTYNGSVWIQIEEN